MTITHTRNCHVKTDIMYTCTCTCSLCTHVTCCHSANVTCAAVDFDLDIDDDDVRCFWHSNETYDADITEVDDSWIQFRKLVDCKYPNTAVIA